MKKLEEIIGLAGETIIVVIATTALIVSVYCLSVELGRMGTLLNAAAAAEEMPDPEVIPLGTPVEEAPGLSMDAQVKLIYFGGFALEEIAGKLVLQRGFTAGLCRQVGVQMQVLAMDKAGLIAGDPLTAAFQGFLIGL